MAPKVFNPGRLHDELRLTVKYKGTTVSASRHVCTYVRM